MLSAACREAGLAAASLWAAVPTYVPTAPSPKAVLALLEQTSEVLGMWVPTTDLEIAAAAYERQVTELVEEDEETSDYVSQLEQRHDAGGGDDEEGARSLVEEVERYLRDRRRATGVRTCRRRHERTPERPPGAWRGQGRVCSQMRARRRGDLVVVAAGVDLEPDGQPAAVRPAGTDTAGFQHRLASIVNGVAEAPSGRAGCPSMVSGGGPSAGKAGTAVVGVISTSTSSNRAATSSTSASRRRTAAATRGTG